MKIIKLEKWGEMSYWEKRLLGRNVSPLKIWQKKWGEMSFREKRRREKCLREKRLSGRNVFLPSRISNALKSNIAVRLLASFCKIAILKLLRQ